MNFIKFAFIILLATVTLSACNKAGDAKTYNDQIINYQAPVIEKMLALSKAIESTDSAAMYTKLGELDKQIDVSMKGLNDMKPFEGGEQLKTAMMDAFSFYKNITNNEYKRIIEILTQPADSMSVEDYAELTKMGDDITKQEVAIDDKVAKAQSEFAKANHIELTDNELQKKIDAK